MPASTPSPRSQKKTSRASSVRRKPKRATTNTTTPRGSGQKRTPKRAPAKRAPRKKPTREKTRGPVWERAFLAALADTGNVRAACTAAEIGHSTVYDRRKAVDRFADAWDDAMEQAADMLEAEALRRAAHGVKEPVYYKGKVVGHVLKYSDVLLIFLLKAARPAKFRDHYRVEHTGKDGGPLEFDDAREALAAALGSAPGATGGGPGAGAASAHPSSG